MVTMHILTCAVLDYIDNLPVLFVIDQLSTQSNSTQLSDNDYWCFPTHSLCNITPGTFRALPDYLGS